MPLYEYRCDACAVISEFMMKLSDPQPSACPSCAKGPLTKILSETAFQLKGGGWYSEGYHKGKAEKAAAPSPSGEASTSGNKTAETPAKTEAPAKKTENPPK